VDPDSSRQPSRLRRYGAPRLRVSVSDGRGRRVADGGLARWLARVAPARARGEVAIALVSDARMRILNRSYRRRDYATDVLSFAGPGSPPSRSARRRPGRTPDPGARALGDIVIATGVAKRQAREAGHAHATELRVLALHGLLHLLGYDHEHRADRDRMARAEGRLRRKGGLGAGLMERGPGTVSGRPRA
jgi:probable rRNA maturation factor